MKHLFFTSVFALFIATNFFAQTPPIPPTTPKTTSTVSITKGTSYSLTFDTDDANDNSSVSIKRNNNVYKFNSKFHESKTTAIKQLLIDKLGKENLKISGKVYQWIKNENGEKVFDCKLTEDSLKMYVDKEYTNKDFINMIDDFGIILKDTISGSDSREEETKRAESELKSAEIELARAKKALEKAKRKVNN